MITLVIILLFAFAALTLLIYFAFLSAPRPSSPAIPQTFTVESFFDLNARHFAQIKQALSDTDYNYLCRRGQRRLARRLRRERLEVLTSYLHGLRDDFENLLHLHKMLARLEIEVVRDHLGQVLLARVQFRLLYVLVSVKLALARLTLMPVDVEPLVAAVNRLAQATEAALNELAEAQAQRLRAELS